MQFKEQKNVDSKYLERANFHNTINTNGHLSDVHDLFDIAAVNR